MTQKLFQTQFQRLQRIYSSRPITKENALFHNKVSKLQTKLIRQTHDN